MSSEPLPAPGEAIRELIADVTARIRHGEEMAAIRSELLAEGLNSEIVDHILGAAASRTRSRWRTTIATIVSGVLVILCTVTGFAGGIWAASEIPPAPGLAAMVTCLFGVIVVALGTVAGAAAGIGIAVLLGKWTVSDGDEPE